MNEKSIWGVVGKVWGQITGHMPAGSTGTSGRRCEAGHLMDPNWTTCPYCEAEKRAREKTAHGQPAADANEPVQRSSTMARSPTMTPDSVQNLERGATKVETSADLSPGEARLKGGSRKITAVLVTFTWRPQGQLFEVYEGRNVIGRGTVESEGGRECDIKITTDPSLSNEHAVILCRAGRYECFDRQSANGTFVNGEFVTSQGVNITADRAEIKTGATKWQFIKIHSSAEHGEAPGGPPDSRPAESSSHRHGETKLD